MDSVTLLLVDDEPTVLNIISRVLTKDGFKILSAATGEAAVTLLKQQTAPIGLAIVDMSMPGMDGAQTVDALLAVQPGLPILVASGLCDAETMNRFKPGSVAGFMQKPYDRETLKRTIRGALSSGS